MSLMSRQQGPVEHIRDWADLRKDIKDQLKKYSKTFPLSHINLLLIISNFHHLMVEKVCLALSQAWRSLANGTMDKATGLPDMFHALARHYHIFAKLPLEKWGRSANARSWLHNEAIQT